MFISATNIYLDLSNGLRMMRDACGASDRLVFAYVGGKEVMFDSNIFFQWN